METDILFCICCLERNVAYYNLVTCSHSEFLKGLPKPKLEPLHQVICYLCHNMLKEIKQFRDQIEASFKTLESQANIPQSSNKKQTHLNLQKMEDINIPRADSKLYECQTNIEIQKCLKRSINNGLVTNCEEEIGNKKALETVNTKPPKSINDKRIKNIKTALSIINKNKNDDCINLLVTSLQSIAATNLISASQTLLGKSANILNNVSIPKDNIEVSNYEVKTEIGDNEDDAYIVNTGMNVDVINEKETIPVIGNLEFEEAANNKPLPDAQASNLVDIKTITREELMQERSFAAKSATYKKCPYHCESCIVGFHYKENLDDHVNRKHCPKPGSVTCDVCLQVLHPPETYTAHSIRHYTRYKCVKCGKLFGSYEAAHEHHKREHNDKCIQRYRCRRCKYKTNSKKLFRCHVLKNHSRATCKLCGARLMTGRKLKTHIV